MEAVARHAHPQRRPQPGQQVELDFRRGRVAGAHPDDADARVVGGTGPQLSRRMDPEGKGHVAQIARLDARANPAANELKEAVAHVFRRPRVIDRNPGRAARAPVFGDFASLADDHPVLERLRRDLAQGFLVDNRDPCPLVGIVEPVGIDAVQPARVERRALRPLEGNAFAAALDRVDFVLRRRQLEVHRSSPPVAAAILEEVRRKSNIGIAVPGARCDSLGAS